MSYESNFQVGIEASPEEIYKTLTEPKKLAQWWTSDMRASGKSIFLKPQTQEGCPADSPSIVNTVQVLTHQEVLL
jgi:uncharacterized protein YndB with AHSA1/START domain